MHTKKKWEAPTVATFGDVTVLTQQTPVKLKTLGLADDFMVPGISDP